MYSPNWGINSAWARSLAWPSSSGSSVTVAVNVSAKQFIRPGYRKAVAAALQASGLPPGRLELEITESVFVGDLETVDAIFRDLKKLGVRLSLDDFGTGYSSLGYLKHGHFNKIKIDQSFVRGCTENGDTNPAIITAIVALAKALGMETVAEGVEAMDELGLVRERGADPKRARLQLADPLKLVLGGRFTRWEQETGGAGGAALDRAVLHQCQQISAVTGLRAGDARRV